MSIIHETRTSSSHCFMRKERLLCSSYCQFQCHKSIITMSLVEPSRKRSSDTPVAATKEGAYSKTRLRVRIKKFHAVAQWSWNVGNGSDDEVCGICQSAFEGCPPGVKFPGDESPVVFGTCGHAFHLQCIATWLGSNKQTCPICRADWEYGNSGDRQGSGNSNAAGANGN